MEQNGGAEYVNSEFGIILSAVFKWRPAKGVVYTFAKMCVKSFFFDFFS